MAKTTIVEYRVKPERVEEHEALVRNVFAELARTAPAGLRYSAYKRPDGVSFVHVALSDGDESPLLALPAFKAFVERIRERCDIPPNPTSVTEIGSFGR
jgi:hypothetical protein